MKVLTFLKDKLYFKIPCSCVFMGNNLGFLVNFSIYIYGCFYYFYYCKWKKNCFALRNVSYFVYWLQKHMLSILKWVTERADGEWHDLFFITFNDISNFFFREVMYISYAGELFLRMLKANFRKQMTLQKSQYAKKFAQ